MAKKITIDRRLLAEKLHKKRQEILIGCPDVPLTFEKHICVYWGTPEPENHNMSCCSNIDCIIESRG